jgi:Effector Associated Constant Component 1
MIAALEIIIAAGGLASTVASAVLSRFQRDRQSRVVIRAEVDGKPITIDASSMNQDEIDRLLETLAERPDDSEPDSQA